MGVKIYNQKDILETGYSDSWLHNQEYEPQSYWVNYNES